MKKIDPNKLSMGLKIIEKSDYRNLINNENVCNLYIYGENDSISPPEIKNFIKLLEPLSKIKVIQNSSHIPFLTNSEDFFKILKENI
mgnify:CR=1 FL=1